MLYTVQIDDQQSIVGQCGQNWIVVGHISIVAPGLQVTPGRIHSRDANDLIQSRGLADVDNAHPIGQADQCVFRTIWGGVAPHIIGAGARVGELAELLHIEAVLGPKSKRPKNSKQEEIRSFHHMHLRR